MAKVVFLDRDGVINKYPGNFKYVTSLKDFKFIPGSKKAISHLYKSGYKLFIISNQAGVTKKIYTQEALDEITDRMLKEISAMGGEIEKVLYCIHTDEQNCDCRKPKTGLINKALNLVRDIDIKNSFFIGDSIRDVKTGMAIGCKTILVLSGREKIENKKDWEAQPDFIAKDLSRAAEIILIQNNN